MTVETALEFVFFGGLLVAVFCIGVCLYVLGSCALHAALGTLADAEECKPVACPLPDRALEPDDNERWLAEAREEWGKWAQEDLTIGWLESIPVLDKEPGR